MRREWEPDRDDAVAYRTPVEADRELISNKSAP